jgi:hypothetical protein
VNQAAEENDKMNKDTDDSHIYNLLAILPKDKRSGMPLHRLQKCLLGLLGSSELVDQTVTRALREAYVDKVIDYEQVDGELQPFHPSWHLKRLKPHERYERLRLLPVECALLQLLWQQDDERLPGQLPLNEVNHQLSEMGFSEREVRLVSSGIPNLVHWYLADDRSQEEARVAQTVEWLGILEEARRHPSPEYSDERREADEEFKERQRARELFLEESIPRHKGTRPHPRKAPRRKGLRNRKEHSD